MPVSFYEVVWIFLIYGFFGWCTEVAYVGLSTGKFVNRGFLNGPICPIYGCGVLLVVVALTPLKENLLILFFGSFLLTTAIEFVTGFLLEKLFHNKWWDYSNQPFNVCGYICLKFSVMWGLACTFVMKIVHPLIYKMIHGFPHIPGVIIQTVLAVLFIIDASVTVATILKFNKRIRMLEEIGSKLHKVSDEIGENIYENVSTAREKSEEKKKEYEELSRKYKELLEQKNFGFKRLVKAFPDMMSKERNDVLQKYKKHFDIKKHIKKGEKED